MEALKSSLRPEAVTQQQSHGVPSEDADWVVENGGFWGDGFVVDEFLDLGEFGNDEKESEEDVKEAEAEKMETENDNNNAPAASPSSSPSSSYYPAVSFGAPLPPLSEISLSPRDAEELEWVSSIIDESCSEFPTGAVALFQSIPQTQTQSNGSDHREARRHPQVAAAATQGASCLRSIVNVLSAEAPVPARAKRSKRSRTATVSWSSLTFTDSSSSSSTAASSASCSSASSSPFSCLIYDHPAVDNARSSLSYESHHSLPLSLHKQSKKQKVPKKRGRKPKHPLISADPGAAVNSGEQRCSHCGVKKTPQWRAGPLGAKTLCNACGVRYKSGRLLPEYRPACSPTFQIAIHSNSHRKVLEMRRKKEEKLLATACLPPIATC